MVEPVSFVPLARVLSATDPSSSLRATLPAPPSAPPETPPANESPTYVTTLRNVAALGAPVDGQRVTALREQIEQRTYQIDSARIADAMLSFVGSER